MDALAKINVRGKELEFHREIPADASINDKLPNSGLGMYFSTLGRKQENGLGTIFHYHEFTGIYNTDYLTQIMSSYFN
jgi:hypothetical protein